MHPMQTKHNVNKLYVQIETTKSQNNVTDQQQQFTQ